MRPRGLLAAILLLIVACVPRNSAPSPSAAPTTGAPAVTATPNSAASPSPTLEPAATPASAAPQAVHFSDALRGWIGTQDGLLGTTDGGATWDRQLTGASITKIWSYDATRAWAVTPDGALYRTQDGTHWIAVFQSYPNITEIDAFSPDLLWAIGVTPVVGPQPAAREGNVLRSEDGGDSWHAVGTHTMWSVCFDTTTDGLGAEGRQLFKTHDAGRTWMPAGTLPIGDNGPWYPTLSCPSGTFHRVQVTEPYAALGHAPYLVFRTTDGGGSWVLEFREGYTLGTTTPPNTAQLGSYPSIMGSTLAGGRVWFITCTPAVDSQEFVFLGPTGDTLAHGPVPIPGCAADGQVIDQTHVIAVAGSTASVIVTADGGGTWRTIYRGTPRR